MSVEGLPQEIVRFIRSCIHSVGQLEILLLLESCEPIALSAAQVNERLRSNIEAVQQRLAALLRCNLVEPDNADASRFRFAPANDDLRTNTRQLAELYRSYPTRVIDAIYSAPDRMQVFSDAFRFKKDGDSNNG
ncbi:MAG: hypothetical protein IT366_22105 [Candidatus Hydrogenedentes bacterium]|nr:hypothetical protein [Candidatus Hydrogenedentota bacterium]